MDISNLTQQQKVEALQVLYHDVAGMGREGDTMLAHINPQEAALLKALGGSGTINPNTGLPEYKKAVRRLTKIVAKAAPFLGLAALGAGFAGYGPLAGLGTAAGGTSAATIAKAGVTYPTSLVGAGASTSQAGLFGGKILSNVASAITKNPLTAVGTALQGVGYVQQRKAVSEQAQALESQARAQEEQNKMQQRYQETLARRQRLDILRQQRIISGRYQTAGAGAGLGLQGTSAITGATSSVGTQTTANLGAINLAEGASQAISDKAQEAANYGSAYYTAQGTQSMWQSMSSLGGFLQDKESSIISIFNKGTIG